MECHIAISQIGILVRFRWTLRWQRTLSFNSFWNLFLLPVRVRLCVGVPSLRNLSFAKHPWTVIHCLLSLSSSLLLPPRSRCAPTQGSLSPTITHTHTNISTYLLRMIPYVNAYHFKWSTCSETIRTYFVSHCDHKCRGSGIGIHYPLLRIHV